MNWQQLGAILWLRWRLTKNQFAKAGSFSAALSIIILVVIGSCSVFFAVGGIAGGVAAGRMAKPELLLLICDGAMALFLFIWLIGLVTELQRTESIDLGKLLHLPITLRQVFLFNFAASHFTPSLILFAPLMFGFCLGLTLGGGLRFLLLALSFLSVMLMITAWTYCLRGWLSALMSNKRRGRTIAVWFTIILVGIGQLPNLILNMPGVRASKAATTAQALRNERLRTRFVNAHVLLPPGWIGYSAWSLKRGEYGPTLAATLLAALFAAAGLKRSHTLTLRYYRDAQTQRAKKKKGREAAILARAKPLLVERSISFLRDDTAGLALATFRSLTRAPEIKLTLIMPLVILIAGFGTMFHKMRSPPDQRLVPFAVTAGVMLVPFTIAALMGNIFGLDRGGFRALILSPMPRQQILFARNLAMTPFILAGAVVALGLAKLVFHATASVIATGLLQAATGFLLFAILSNFLAIFAPYRVSMNTLQAKKFKPITLVSALASMMIWPVISLLIAIPVGLQLAWQYLEWPAWIPVNVVSGAGLCALACWLYALSLPAQGRLLQKRELVILKEVTAEAE